MYVNIISRPEFPDHLVGFSAGVCYHSSRPDSALRSAISSGHGSVLQHANYTFLIEGLSRVALAQLTRHRIASFSVESQRYCGIKDFDIYRPKSLSKHTGSVDAFLQQCQDMYEELVQNGVPPEDARYLMPQGVKTRLVMTMNVQQLRHFFSLRCCNRAQTEIRELARMMLHLCKQDCPVLFRDAGCACMCGKPCPEGRRSCGEPYKAWDAVKEDE